MTKSSLILLIIVAFTGCFSDRSQYTILFDRVDGLNEGSPVLNKGITIGKVTHMDLFENQVAVDLRLTKNVVIPHGSKFYVRDHLLGISYVDIEYSNENIFLTSKDTSTGRFQKEALMDNIISDTTKRKKIERSLEKIANGIGELIQSTRDTVSAATPAKDD